MPHGTWQTTGGGDDGIQTAMYYLVAAVLVMAGASWVLRHMLWIAIPAGVMLLVAAGGLVWWLRGKTAREARFAVAIAAQRERHELSAPSKPQVTQGTTRPAIEQHIHYHYHAADSQDAARVIPGRVVP